MGSTEGRGEGDSAGVGSLCIFVLVAACGGTGSTGTAMCRRQRQVTALSPPSASDKGDRRVQRQCQCQQRGQPRWPRLGSQVARGAEKKASTCDEVLGCLGRRAGRHGHRGRGSSHHQRDGWTGPAPGAPALHPRSEPISLMTSPSSSAALLPCSSPLPLARDKPASQHPCPLRPMKRWLIPCDTRTHWAIGRISRSGVRGTRPPLM